MIPKSNLAFGLTLGVRVSKPANNITLRGTLLP